MVETDGTVVEAASWRLASELVRRHPSTVRLIRAHPGGGMYDCLWLLPFTGEDGSVLLNRVGSIQVHSRFDGQPVVEPVRMTWADYISADPRAFLEELERAAGLETPPSVPAATPRTLTYRLLAALTATAFKTVHPIQVEEGYIDSSGGGGPNENLDLFPIDGDRLRVVPDDFYGEVGYRFWIVVRDGEPVLAIDQTDGFAWTRHRSEPIDLMSLYVESGRRVLVTALEVLRRLDAVS